MIIPHIIDQFVWDKIVNDLGAGPGGIKIWQNYNTESRAENP